MTTGSIIICTHNQADVVPTAVAHALAEAERDREHQHEDPPDRGVVPVDHELEAPVVTAIAASTAEPPLFRMSIPICAARGCEQATIPCSAMTYRR